jgi:hypothetical protein
MIVLKAIFFTVLIFLGVAIVAGDDLQSSIIFFIFPIVLFILILFSGKNKKQQEKANSPEDKIEPEKKPLTLDFSNDKRAIVKDLVLETNKHITQALKRVSSDTFKKNLQLLYSQVSSIYYNYSQRKLSFDQVVVELNLIQRDTETLSKELETFNTNIADEVDLTFIEETNYFKLFGLNQDATYQEIKLAYMGKVKQYHPDKVAGGSQQEKMKAQKICQKINKAYQVLTNQLKINSVLQK